MRVFGCIVLLLLLVHNASAQASKPNVIIIICDDLNDAVEGMGGHPQAKTPAIDKLMDNGVQFTNAHCNAPLCGPSRASIWSGLYPHTTGIYGNGQHWRTNPVMENTITAMEHFKANGYEVLGTGKVHHNGHEDWSIFSSFGLRPTFGPFPWDGVTVNANGRKPWMSHPDMPEAMQGGRISWEDSFGPISDIPEYKPDPAKGTPGYRGWVLYNEPYRYLSDNDRDLMPDELSAKWAAEQIMKPRTRPFFLTVGFNRPHTPLYAPKKYFDMFPLEEIELPPYLENDIEDCAPAFWRDPVTGKKRGYGFERFEQIMQAGGVQMWKRWIQAYLACVAFVDDQVGVVLDALQKSPYADNTIVIFTSDHGYQMGEKDYLFKMSIWEESTRVPLIVKAPGISQPGTVCDYPVSLVDLYPTISDLCGLPGNPNAGGNEKPLDGHTIRPFLENPASNTWDGPPIALSVVAGLELKRNEQRIPERQHFTVRSERWRYTRCNNGDEELYDHESDPNEWRNLTDDSQYREIKMELKSSLFKLTGMNSE